MDEINIQSLRNLCNDDTIILTQHMFNRMGERNIEYNDIKSCILTGEIIEQYPTDYPFPSCLVLGKTESGKPIHVNVGLGNGAIYFITAYFPDLIKWEKGYKIRKGNK